MRMFTSLHLSHVPCHISHVTCHMSHVTCDIFSFLFFLQIGETSRWRVCYQRGLPSLVLCLLMILSSLHCFVLTQLFCLHSAKVLHQNGLSSHICKFLTQWKLIHSTNISLLSWIVRLPVIEQILSKDISENCFLVPKMRTLSSCYVY